MNNKISAAVGFVAGVGAGFAGCYVLLKKKNELKLNEKVESLKNTYEKLGGAIKTDNKPEATVKKIDKAIDKAVDETFNRKVDDKVVKTTEDDEDADDEDEGEDYDDYEGFEPTKYEEIVKSYREDDPIQLISEPEYADTTNGYDKKEFTYYDGDEEHVIDVDTGHEVPDWMSLLGYDDGLLNHELFEEYDGVVYIRNNAMCTDYMVTKSGVPFM